MTLTVDALDRAAGSVALFPDTVDDGRPVLLAVGHREAKTTVDAIEAGPAQGVAAPCRAASAG